MDKHNTCIHLHLCNYHCGQQPLLVFVDVYNISGNAISYKPSPWVRDRFELTGCLGHKFRTISGKVSTKCDDDMGIPEYVSCSWLDHIYFVIATTLGGTNSESVSCYTEFTIHSFIKEKKRKNFFMNNTYETIFDCLYNLKVKKTNIPSNGEAENITQ